MTDTTIAALLIQYSVSLVMIVFGISQIKSPATWLAYIPRPVRFIIPFDIKSFMRMHGVGNLALGLLLASGLWQPVSIWLTLGWWVFILPFAAYYHWTDGMRDLAIVMAITALLVLS